MKMGGRTISNKVTKNLPECDNNGRSGEQTWCYRINF